MRRAIGRFMSMHTGSAIHRRLLAPLDNRLVRLTHGRAHFAKGAIPLVLVRTTGAKSGLSRDVMLTYFTDEDDVIVIASNYGQASHPSWYHNLLKNAQCQVFADGRPDRGGDFIARAAEGEDRNRLYALAERYTSNFSAYAANTDGLRAIPVLRLTPQSS